MPHPVNRRKARFAILQRAKRRQWRLKRVKQQSWKCFYCGGPFTWDNPSTLDHVVPLSKGGEDHYENTVAACSKCNWLKDNLSVADFLKGALGKDSGPAAVQTYQRAAAEYHD